MSFWPLIKTLPTKTNFKFVDFAKFAAMLSAVAIAAAMYVVLLPLKPPCLGLSCGIDFAGGTVLEFSTAPKPADTGHIREVLNDLKLGEVQVQAFGGPSTVSVRYQTPEGQSAAVVTDKVKAALSAEIGKVTYSRTDAVGAKVSGELLTKGIGALLGAIGLMLLYIWFRFELQFGLGAVAALFHDVFLTFGVIALLKIEFNLTIIAAILTIIGYSMNDTVVVFDRLRENLRKFKKMPLREVIDLSINETLSRTIITGLTAILALGGLAVLGGEALFGFSLVLLFGIVIGTYSSIYVAAPIILLWGVKRGDEEAKPIDWQPAARNPRTQKP
jgi:preprotein translocase subunit SecF